LAEALRTAVVLTATAVTACGGPAERVWNEEADHRWAELDVPRRGQSGFRQLDPGRTGVTFANGVTEEQIMQNEHVLNGSGVALGDVDGDGTVDLYFAKLDGPNELYRNTGRLRFERVADAGGAAADDRLSTGAAFADADGDGDLDLFVTSMGGPHSYYENDGTGRFTDRTETSGLLAGYYGTTMAFADVDADGDLDLYVANNKVRTIRDSLPPNEIEFDRVVMEQPDGSVTLRPGFEQHYALQRSGNVVMRQERAEPDVLYLNDGQGRFAPVDPLGGRFLDESGEPITEVPVDWGLSARFFDMDGDGDADLYVCNDFESPDHVWVNDGTGHFHWLPTRALRTISNANMAIDVGDLDRDGHTDIVTVDMLDVSSGKQRTQTPASVVMLPTMGEPTERQQLPRNALLLNRGDGSFAEVGLYAGLEASGWTWSVILLDVDLDGYEDVLTGNGHEHDFLDTDTRNRIRRLPTDRDWRRLRFLYPPLHLPNVAYRNDGDSTFTVQADGWGLGVEADVAHGMGTADLDGDGDLDVVANRLGAPAGVYENVSAEARVLVRLRGSNGNRGAVGAVIHVRAAGLPLQSKEVTLGGPYVSTSDLAFAFAAGRADSLDIAVRWTDGTWSAVPAVANRAYEIRNTGSTPDAPTWLAEPPADEPWFVRDDAVRHTHTEAEYDDFRRQPLLPYKLSRGGPAVAWSDLDRDGDDDLVLGTGAGGQIALFRNDAGRLVPVRVAMPPAPLDLTTIVPIPGARGTASLLIGQMNYEAVSPDASVTAASVIRIDIDLGQWRAGRVRLTPTPVVPGAPDATGPLAAGDVDGDGDLDLFVGARTLPARYPLAATSRIVINDGGTWRVDEANADVLSGVGLVNGAVMSDVDGDADLDLVIAREWGPVTVLRNDGGRFTDATTSLGLAEHTGLWNGVATGDVNGDGRLDIVATNWGLNTRWRASPERPLEVVFDDFDGNGVFDLVLAQFDSRVGALVPLPGLNRLSRTIGYVNQLYTQLSDYANATLADVLGPPLRTAGRLQVRTLAHTVFLSDGERFTARPLPMESQLAPAFHVGVADVDGDGNEDVFTTQNFYPTEEGTQRYHAGRAMWLRGDGNGGLVAVPGRESGIDADGDQRGAAFADIDRDGRLDLAIGQNAYGTVVVRNVGTTPSLRVRLEGPADNPHAVGAQVRIVYADGEGPLREVQAGSGYWSSNSPTQLLGLRASPVEVHVRWPDGTTDTAPVRDGDREVRVRWAR
jgi:hypothetical protein